MRSGSNIIPAGVWQAYGLRATDFVVSPISTGHINATYKLVGRPGYVLQQVNTAVFSNPDIIASNLEAARLHLRQHAPDYLFLAPLATRTGEMFWREQAGVWRLFPLVEDSITVNEVATVEEAFDAAAAFGRLTRLLSNANVAQFRPVIERFHDLAWRYEQLQQALEQTSLALKREAAAAIAQAQEFSFLVARYQQQAGSGGWPLRITHNDTKINNLLLHEQTRKPIAVIDLDTLMPGYFLYDVGDLLRTVAPPVSEEERATAKVVVRQEFAQAVIEGYQSEMGNVLTAAERESVTLAGPMLAYMMAIRFLADYLRGNTYYHISYADQNLVRAQNQLKLVGEFLK
jgi:Ser/Thr protein kinase RdoA (MazF antagonist)